MGISLFGRHLWRDDHHRNAKNMESVINIGAEMQPKQSPSEPLLAGREETDEFLGWRAMVRGCVDAAKLN